MKIIGLPILDDAINQGKDWLYFFFSYLLGKSGLILNFGSSNADKMHTIMGNTVNEGLLPRLIRVLLEMKNKVLPGTVEDIHEIEHEQVDGVQWLVDKFEREGERIIDFKIHYEAFEIYNEEIYDLLKENKKDKITGAQIKQKLQLKDKDTQKVFIRGNLYNNLDFILIPYRFEYTRNNV